MSFLDRFSTKLQVPAPGETLPGRDHEIPGIPTTHAVLGTPIRPPFPEGRLQAATLSKAAPARPVLRNSRRVVIATRP